ncbi:MAG: transporter [Porticoccaceae bacterium]|nr:transporter [Porticoccaceae bacterium]
MLKRITQSSSICLTILLVAGTGVTTVNAAQTTQATFTSRSSRRGEDLSTPKSFEPQPAAITLSLSDQDGPTGVGHRYSAPPGLPPNDAATGVIDRMPDRALEQVTVDGLLSIALQRNPTLRQSQAHITAETGRAIQAGLYPNPVIRYSAEQIGVGGTAGEFHGGIISQEIVRGGKLQLSRAKYAQRIRVAEALALAQQFRVTNDVQAHFYHALALQRRVALRQELLKSAEDHALSTREAYNMGQANVADIRRANVRLQSSRLDLLAEQNQLNQRTRQLSALAGLELSPQMLAGELDGEPVPLDYQQILESLFQLSPELIAARAKAQSDRITVERELVEPVPNLNVEGGAGYNYEADQTVATAGVSIRLPLYDRNQGTIQQARADLARQWAEIERIEFRLQQDLATQFQNYVTASQHVDQYRTLILPEYKEAYRLTLESYRENRINWSEVLQSQQDYYMARMDYADWLARWRESEVMIDGMLLHGGLNAAPGVPPAGHIDAIAKPR